MNLLNEVGAWAWHRRDGTRSIEEISRMVLARFQSPTEEKVAADVQAFVSELITLGALVWRETGEKRAGDQKQNRTRRSE